MYMYMYIVLCKACVRYEICGERARQSPYENPGCSAAHPSTDWGASLDNMVSGVEAKQTAQHRKVGHMESPFVPGIARARVPAAPPRIPSPFPTYHPTPP